MASIRRTLSPVARPGSAVNGEAGIAASPLSKSSLYNSNNLQHGSALSSCFGSFDYALYRAQTCLFSVFSQRSSRSLERSKSMRQSWRRALFHFFVCFFLGVFAGLTSFASPISSFNLFYQHQAISYEMIEGVDRIQFYNISSNVTLMIDGVNMNNSSMSGQHVLSNAVKDTAPFYSGVDQSLDQNSNVSFHKLLIIVTPTYTRPLQPYYLNRMAHTLKLVPPPLLWIVVEMTSQSMETAEVLSNSGIMYRHLIWSENLTDVNDRSVHLLNVALAHIETHHLDGITYFADDDDIYSLELFAQMRQISRFGTWTVGKLVETSRGVILDGPICNGSQVIGWHTNDRIQNSRRFHAEMLGFAFNSTILWDPKRWHRPTLEPVRLLDTSKGAYHVSSFIEQIVEDETQMEGLPLNCSRIMVWHHSLLQFKSFPHELSMDSSLNNGPKT